MKNNIIYLTKLTAIAFFSFVKINLIGTLSTLIVAILGFMLLSKDISTVQPTVIDTTPYLVKLFYLKPITTVVFCLTIILSPFLFFVLGNKYILSKLIHKIIADGSENYIDPILDKLLVTIKDKKDILFIDNKNYPSIKERWIKELGNHHQNRWIKKIVSYGLKKVNLDDLNFKDKNISTIAIIKTKTIEALKNISAPNAKSIWAVLILQWIILILVWLLPY